MSPHPKCRLMKILYLTQLIPNNELNVCFVNTSRLVSHVIIEAWISNNWPLIYKVNIHVGM